MIKIFLFIFYLITFYASFTNLLWHKFVKENDYVENMKTESNVTINNLIRIMKS